MTRSVLVTGAAGFLGRAFVRHHAAAGDEVFGVDDLSNPHSFWPGELREDHRTESDAGDRFTSLPDPGRRFDLAYHFAAPVGGRVKIEGDPLFNADCLRLDSQFYRWAVAREVPTVVYPSSGAVYGVNFQTEEATLLHEGLFEPP